MISFSKPSGPETTVRLLLLLNNSVALALSFAILQPLFIAVGSIFGVSILFNLFTLLAKIGSRRSLLKIDNGLAQCPSMFGWGIDMLGVLAFLALYVSSTIYTATRSQWDWPPTLLMAYASIGTLVACSMHGFLAVRNLQNYIRYRQSLSPRCPHCRGEMDFAASGIALPPSPEEQDIAPAEPRQSFSANSTGENEGDMLIMKS